MSSSRSARALRRAVMAVAVAGVAVMPEALSATVTIPLPLTRMVQVSDLVVEASVVAFMARDNTVAQGENCPAVALRYTDILLRARQVYRNRLSSQFFIVRVLGGRVEEGRILRDTYLPFRIGERVLLFVQLNGTDDFPFVGFHQGILRFRSRNPNGSMPDLNAPDACTDCPQLVVDGRDHLLLGFTEGRLNTIPASRHPAFRVVVGPGQNVPAEPAIPPGGVFPAGTMIPQGIATPATVRSAVQSALQALGLPSSPPPLGDPGQPLAPQLRPNQPIVRCGLPALLSDEAEAFEVVPGGDVDPPIVPGPNERRHP